MTTSHIATRGGPSVSRPASKPMPTPRARILAVYDVLGTLFAQPDYRGCAFMNATAEAAPDSVEAPRRDDLPRLGTQPVFSTSPPASTPADPKPLAETLVLLYDGAVATAQMDKAPDAARHRTTHRRVHPRQHQHSIGTDHRGEYLDP